MSARRYRKKPVVIEALQYEPARRARTLEIQEWAATAVPGAAIYDTRHLAWDFDQGGWILPSGKRVWAEFSEDALIIETLEGHLVARAGWWIIRGVQGEFYPCDPEVFEATYEPAIHEDR